MRVDSSFATGSVTPALVARALKWTVPAAAHFTVTLYTASAFGASRGSGSNASSPFSIRTAVGPVADLYATFSAGSVHTTFTSVSVTDPVLVTRTSYTTSPLTSTGSSRSDTSTCKADSPSTRVAASPSTFSPRDAWAATFWANSPVATHTTSTFTSRAWPGPTSPRNHDTVRVCPSCCPPPSAVTNLNPAGSTSATVTFDAGASPGLVTLIV